MNLSLDFFLPESKYIELESRSEELQGAHEVGGRALGGQARPHPRGQGMGPLMWILEGIEKRCLEGGD